MLKLMYITNRTDVAAVAQSVGVDRIFVDMEFIGKDARQKGLDTVKLHHTVEDVRKIRDILTTTQLLVRINPIHDELPDYDSSEEEIDRVIKAGADIVMLPFFKTTDEVHRFLDAVGGRARTMLLMETPEAAEAAEKIVQIPGIDEIHIGINDMSLGLGKKFMFELLADGTVDRLCGIIGAAGIPYGFGGIASLGGGMLPSEYVIREHYRLGSSFAILSRSFCNTTLIPEIDRIEQVFRSGVRAIRDFEAECAAAPDLFEENRKTVIEKVRDICKTLY